MATPTDTALLTTNSETLAPLLPILNAFAHRHKNQHSSTHWWSSFSVLRRAVRNLAVDLVLRPKKTKPSNAKRESHPALVRAKWMMRHVVPGAFVAFSQLAADNQHAPLGLLLLSILARVNTIISHLVPTGHNHEPSASAITKPILTDSKRSIPSDSTVQEPPSPTIDMGVAISRDELLLSRRTMPESDTRLKDQKPKERKSKIVHTETHTHSSRGDAKDRPKKKKKKGGDALSSLFGSL